MLIVQETEAAQLNFNIWGDHAVKAIERLFVASVINDEKIRS